MRFVGGFFFFIFLTVWFLCFIFPFITTLQIERSLNKFKYFLLRRQNSQIVIIKFIILLHDIINLARKRGLSLDEIITIYMYTHVRLSKQTIP